MNTDLSIDSRTFANGNIILFKRQTTKGFPLTFISTNICTQLGYQADELLNNNFPFRDLIHIEDLLKLEQEFIAAKDNNEAYLDISYRLQNKEGEYIWFEEHSYFIKDENDNIIESSGYLSNISKEREAKNKIKELTYLDNLTSLPNRIAIISKLNQAILHAKKSRSYGALIYIGLDRFKKVNDGFGHAFGDKLLMITAERLRKYVKEHDMAARMSGDEFAFIVTQIGSNKEEAAKWLQRHTDSIRASMNDVFNIDGQRIKISGSYGICLFPDKNNSAEEIIKFADMAMTTAKDSGHNNIRFFDNKMRLLAENRISLERELLKAIEEQQFILYFQPIVNRDRNIIAFESLIRWIHPEKGFVSPGEFIPFAENSGMIQKISEIVIDNAFKQILEWENNNFFSSGRIKYLSINISPNQFWHVDFMNNLREKLKEYNITPSHLLIEITENIFIADLQDAIDKLNEIKALGFQIALDDFGSGYSALSYLMQLPLDFIKLDRSFIQEIHKNEVKAAIVESVCNIAQKMELKIIAEGIETVDEIQALVNFDCHAYQGYYFYKPMPITDLKLILQKKPQVGFNDLNNTCEIPTNLNLTNEMPLIRVK